MSVSANWFQVWFNSPYYQILNDHLKGDAGKKVIPGLIGKLGLPAGSQVADLACREGANARLIEQLGFDVTGVDLAPDSIAIAKNYETEKLHFFQHDLRLPYFINYFDAALNLSDSFGFYRTEHEHYNAIRTVSQSLRPNAAFVIDYQNTHYAENNLIPKQEFEIAGIKFFITNWFDENHYYRKIYIEDDKQLEPLEFTEKFTKFSLGDFTDMLAFHHLQIQEVYGDYNFTSYDLTRSPRLIMIARKLVPPPGTK
jgi:SAM-dependent methyltransferase